MSIAHSSDLGVNITKPIHLPSGDQCRLPGPSGNRVTWLAGSSLARLSIIW